MVTVKLYTNLLYVGLFVVSVLTIIMLYAADLCSVNSSSAGLQQLVSLCDQYRA